MKIVILCGGKGTRMREETEFKPKPLVEIGGRPVLWHIMKMFAHHGFHDFCLCLGYKGEMIKRYFLDYEAMNADCTVSLGQNHAIRYHSSHGEQGFSVTMADTGLDAWTGARVKRVEPYIDGDTFMVTYGDGLSDVNIQDLLSFHISHGKLATVTAYSPMSRYGVMDIQANNQVSHFAEKPQVEGWVSAGFFVFQKEFLKYLSPDPMCILEREPLKRLAREGQLMAYKHDGFFYAMDTYRDYLHLNQLWDEGKAPWAVEHLTPLKALVS